METSVSALERGGRPALVRAMAAVESSPRSAAVVALLDALHAAPRGYVAGFTGPPGAGKSTLLGALAPHLQAQGKRAAVIAVDPSSRRSGGALLGDRIRIAAHAGGRPIFVRSMAAQDAAGGLSAQTYPVMVMLRALYDWVLIETVGVGQSESAIADAADCTIFCVQPGAGDALQYMKAGIMELPDAFLIVKSDLPEASRTEGDLRTALAAGGRHAPFPPIIRCSAREGTGLEAFGGWLLAHAQSDLSSGRCARARALRDRRWIEGALRESFGRIGLALLCDALPEEGGAPFSLQRALFTDLESRFLRAREK